MARLVTRAILRARTRQRADVENDPHVSDPEVNDLVQEAVPRVWDILVGAAPPDYYSKEAAVTGVAGQIVYPLSDIAADFYKLRRVWIDGGNGKRREVTIARDDVRDMMQPPAGGEAVIVRYIPCAPLFDDDDSTFDGINGWEELIVLEAAIDIVVKQERDPSALMAKRARDEERIRSMATRDVGSPQTIRRTAKGMRSWAVSTPSIDGYQLVGSNLELYRTRLSWP